jgi:AAA domain
MDAYADPEAAMRAVGVEFSDYRSEEKARLFGRLRILSVDDALDAPPRDYLLDGLIAPAEFSVWWGAPKCGKSFLLLRITYGMAQGVGLWGREAVAVPVCYVAAEGGNGIKGRIHALRKRMGPAPNFHFIAQAVDIWAPNADLDDLIKAISALGSRLVLDTLARVMGSGNESATQDMNAFVRNCLRIQEETGAHVAVVHHGGWEGSHARGSIALIGAADIVVKVSGEQGGPKTALVELAKDDDSGYPLGFDLAEVELPPDAKGRPRKTYVVEEREAPEVAKARKDGPKLSAGAESLLRHITDAIAAGQGRTDRPIPGMPPVPTISKHVLIPHLIQRGWLQVSDGVSGTGNRAGTVPKSEHTRLWKRLDLLQDKRLVGFDRESVWLAEPAQTP